MPSLWIILLLIMVITAAVLLIARPRILTLGPRGEIGYTLFWYFGRVFCRTLHRATWVNAACAPQMNESGPLIVVSNHTGGIDPLLISSGVPFHIRWMMARDTMSPDAQLFWDWMDVLPVDRDGTDMTPLREAIRFVKGGGAIGIFPEGGIENPPGEIRPFIDGVGLLVTRTKAPVLLVWVSGTTFTDSAFGSVFRRSRARVQYAGPLDFSDQRDPRAIAQALRAKLAEMSGWPLNDEVLPTARQTEAAAEVRG